MASTSKHFRSLDNDCEGLYLENILAVGDIDPCNLKKDVLSTDIDMFPSIGYADIVNYFLLAPSPISKEELKSCKSLEP